MSSSFLLGPIPADGKTPFYLATIVGGYFYVLNSWQNTTAAQPLVYYFDPTYLESSSGLPAQYSAPYFTATSGGGELFTLKDATVQPQGAIEKQFRSNKSGGGLALVPSLLPPTATHGTPVPFLFSPSGAAPWEGAFLAGVPYTITDPVSGQVVSFYSGPSPPLPPYGEPSPPFPANNIYILPLNWYPRVLGQCLAGGNVLQAAYCSTVPFSTSALCQAVSPGWTEVSQCQEGLTYQYCLPGQSCGTSNCNGPCQDKKSCQADSSGVFTCQSSPQSRNEIIVITSGVIVLLAGFFLFLIAGAVFLYLLLRKAEKS